MQIIELIKLTKWFDENIVEKGIISKYSSLYRKMNQNIRRSSSQQRIPFEEEKNDLIESIKGVNFENLTLEQINFLKRLGVDELVGEYGVGKIEEVLIQNNLDIATAINKIKEFSDRIDGVQATISELQSTLCKSFDVEDSNEVEEGQVLMRVYFQNEVGIENLTDFKKLSANWYDIGRGIAMALGKRAEDFNIIGAKKGSIIIDMAVVFTLATTVSKILLESLKVADRFINILKQAQELKALKLSNNKLAQEVKKEAEHAKKEGTEQILQLTINDLNIDPNVDGDKVVALKKSITKLIEFTQKGGVVDFVQLNEPEEDKAEIRNEIQRLKTNINEIRSLEDKIKLLESKINE